MTTRRITSSSITSGGGGATVRYQPDQPVGITPGELWVDSDGDTDVVDAETFLTKESASASYVYKNGDTITGPTVITTNSSSNALRITQTGSGNALVVEDSANPDATPFVVDASGRVLVGNSTALANPVSTSQVQVHGTGTGTASTFSGDWGNSSNSFIDLKGKSRGGSVGVNTIVNSQDNVYQLRLYGNDGVAFIEAARITAAVDGTPGTNDMPGRLVFSTTADGASTPTERMRITNAGNVGIGTSSPSVRLEIRASDNTYPVSRLISRSNTGFHGGDLQFRRARETSGSDAPVAADDYLGSVTFVGFDGAGYRTAAAIIGRADAAVSSSDMPGRLQFYTTVDGGTSLTEKMRIDNAGLITGSGTSLGAWTAYTPTWTGFTTNPVVGNGSIVGAYAQIGKIVIGRVLVTMGSTTTYGSGFYSLSLPVASAVISAAPIGHVIYRDSSTGVSNVGHVDAVNVSNFIVLRVHAADQTYSRTVSATSTVPFSFDTSDQIFVRFAYQAA